MIPNEGLAKLLLDRMLKLAPDAPPAPPASSTNGKAPRQRTGVDLARRDRGRADRFHKDARAMIDIWIEQLGDFRNQIDRDKLTTLLLTALRQAPTFEKILQSISEIRKMLVAPPKNIADATPGELKAAMLQQIQNATKNAIITRDKHAQLADRQSLIETKLEEMHEETLTPKGKSMQVVESDFDQNVEKWIEEYGEGVVLRTWDAATSEQNYLQYEPNPKMLAYHELNHPTIRRKVGINLGANRSGKTFSETHGFIAENTNVYPSSLHHLTKPNWRPIKSWVITLDYPTLREAIDEYIQTLVPEHWIENWNPNTHILRWKNLMDPGSPGSVTTFRSADAGARKLASASLDYVWFDEEPPWDVYHQVVARTISTKGLLRLTFTPENGYSWSYKKLYLRRNECEWIDVVHTTMYDNPHLDPDQIAMAEDMFDDEVVYRVRILGEYAELSGQMVFHSSAITRLRAYQQAPLSGGHHVSIWQRPQAGQTYVIGADVASGVADGDYSCAVVINIRTWTVVAMLRLRCQPDEFADHLKSLGHAYNNAKIAVERQNHGTSTLICLRDREYWNLYCHSNDDRVTRQTPSNILGWDTNVRTKEEAVNALREMIGTKTRSTSIRIPSEIIIDELSSFVYYTDDIPMGRSQHKTVGRCGAKYGCFDDTVMATAIAVRVGLNMRGSMEEPDPETAPGTFGELLQDMEQEYIDAQTGTGLEIVGEHLAVDSELSI